MKKREGRGKNHGIWLMRGLLSRGYNLMVDLLIYKRFNSFTLFNCHPCTAVNNLHPHPKGQGGEVSVPLLFDETNHQVFEINPSFHPLYL